MSISMWLRSPALRRGIALSAVVLATGGLVLHRSQASAFPGLPSSMIRAAGKNSATFSGSGAHGTVSLSHTKVAAGDETEVFAEVRLAADKDAATGAHERAPIAMAVVIDTSGSMSGDKMADAKKSVLRLLADMRDSDRIAVVRYSDTAEIVQHLASVGEVRASLSEKIRNLQSGGGTNIPSGLEGGLRALASGSESWEFRTRPSERVDRLVLVSDGLDGTRQQAEALARRAFNAGVTVSSLGVGLDFDESYMGAIASTGHGNFAFVNDGSSIATFLQRELVETASTTVQDAKVRIRLPEGVRFVSATGADGTMSGDELELSMGGLFAGDERRVVVTLAARAGHSGDTLAPFATTASWRVVGRGERTEAKASSLELLASSDPRAVEEGKDGAVFASAMSATASRRQMEAAEAYSSGDLRRAHQITEENLKALREAKASAPKPAAAALGNQITELEKAQSGFRSFAPQTAGGKAAAKAVRAREQMNAERSTY